MRRIFVCAMAALEMFTQLVLTNRFNILGCTPSARARPFGNGGSLGEVALNARTFDSGGSLGDVALNARPFDNGGSLVEVALNARTLDNGGALGEVALNR